jgi:hypothetical protein
MSPPGPSVHRAGPGDASLGDSRYYCRMDPAPPPDRDIAPIARTAAARHARLLRCAVAAAALALTLLAVAGYPLGPGPLAAGLVLYGAVLWRWPGAWLVVVPAALAAFDLAPWTGWSFVEESDLVVLVTIAVLVLRRPPLRGDFALQGLGGAALALVLVACVVGVWRGLALPGLPEGSTIAELRPDNALRVAKGVAIALALLPFLRRAITLERRAAQHLLAAGMTAGLALVATAAIYERMLFPGLLNFDTGYRVVATFSSMHFGGGYVGVYIAMTLPFALALVGRSLPRTFVPLALVAAAGLYALVVTFARAAYASAIVGCVVLVFGWIYAGRRHRLPASSFVAPLVLLAIAAGIIATAATDSPYMESRVGTLMPDLAGRERLWAQGLDRRTEGAATWLFGMGLGSYARTTLAALPRSGGQGNVVLDSEHGRRYLALEGGLPLYVAQKLRILPGQDYRLSFAFRTTSGDAPVAALLCENVMLYSARCSVVGATPQQPGVWQHFDGAIASDGIARRVRLGIFRRPTELAFFLPASGTAADITDISLTDPAGRELVANGDFAQGMARWFLTDDRHTLWRIENQYLMTLFEEGALGLVALVFLAAVALARALTALPRGEPMMPALAASLAAFLSSALFDCPLEVPRLAALFYLTAFAALALSERRPTLSQRLPRKSARA